MSWKLRCDLKISSSKSIIDYVTSSCDAVAYVVEKLDTNPHLHFYLKTHTPPTRYKLRQLCGSGNGGYSLKELDEEYPIEYLAYLCKEGEVTWSGVPQEIIDEAIAYNAKVKADIKAKKDKKTSMVDKLIDYIENHPSEPSINPPNVTRLVVEYHLEEKKLIREFQLVSYVQTILLRLDPSYLNKLCDRILEKVT